VRRAAALDPIGSCDGRRPGLGPRPTGIDRADADIRPGLAPAIVGVGRLGDEHSGDRPGRNAGSRHAPAEVAGTGGALSRPAWWRFVPAGVVLRAAREGGRASFLACLPGCEERSGRTRGGGLMPGDARVQKRGHATAGHRGLLAGAMTAGACVMAVFSGCIVNPRPRYHGVDPPARATSASGSITRGRAVASVLCAHCHADPETGRLSGRRLHEIPGALATMAYASNLTADPIHGIGAYCDADLLRFLRTGIKRDGSLGYPWAPRFPLLSDGDAADLIAYLRSDDPAVRPVALAVPPTELRPVGRLVVTAFARPLPMPAGPVLAPDPSDAIAYGRYVVQGKAKCYACHSAHFTRLDELRPERSKGYLGGGNRLTDMAGSPVHSANLTPDGETGIGRWTEDQFIRAVRDGVRPDGRPLRAPMFPYRDLSDAEVRAAYAYLRTVPALRNRVKRPSIEPIVPPADAPAPLAEGAALYVRYQCRSCHGDSGEGYGDLRGAGRKHPTDDALRARIARPAATDPGAKMPTFDGIIAPGDYPALIAYVRALGRTVGR
jgi:mono/diheme cytochrome c family protein